MSKKKTIKKLRKQLDVAQQEERFPTLVSGCFSYAGIKFHVAKNGLIYQDTDLPEYACEICKLTEEKRVEHWRNVERSFLYGIGGR